MQKHEKIQAALIIEKALKNKPFVLVYMNDITPETINTGLIGNIKEKDNILTLLKVAQQRIKEESDHRNFLYPKEPNKSE